MADDADRAQDDMDLEQDLRAEFRRLTPKYEPPRGCPGDCYLCGEWSGRLIEGACAGCRTRYQLR